MLFQVVPQTRGNDFNRLSEYFYGNDFLRLQEIEKKENFVAEADVNEAVEVRVERLRIDFIDSFNGLLERAFRKISD